MAADGPDGPEAPVRELVRSLRAHPSRLAEVLAVFAVRHRGPRAARRIARLRETHPEATPAELVDRAVAHAKRVSESEGAFVGGPFLVLVPFAFCTALLAQAQLLLELAALSGKDPTDPARAAEVMVLQGAYPDVASAERAIGRAAEAGPVPGPEVGRWRGFWSLISRMARLLGLTGADADPPPSRWRTAAGWVLVGVVFLVGTVAPLVWLPYMGMSYARATDRIAARAATFHFGDAADWRAGPSRVDPGMAAGGLRALVSLLLPLVAIVVLVGADVRLVGSRWPVLGLVLIGLSSLVGWRWHRGRSRRDRSPEPGPGEREE
ncbi:hypothetical protein ACIGZJ_28105 [Kitasatospora sp. NPDC052868]|uniref:hypothetical protein n=1 Tax=Kitasatospora sp. NPDC052868 TaxID=3364060 RepID=UPI0037C5FB1A